MQRIIKRVRVIGQEFGFPNRTKLRVLHDWIFIKDFPFLNERAILVYYLNVMGRNSVMTDAVTFALIVDRSDTADRLSLLHPCNGD